MTTSFGPLYKKKCFEAWKSQFSQKATIARTLKNMCEQACRFQLEFAFKQIMKTHKARSQKALDDHLDGFDRIRQCMSTWDKKKLGRYFNRYKETILKNHRVKQKFRILFLHRATLALRKGFFRWKRSHEQEEAIEEADDHGHARLKLIKMDMDRRNLRGLLE